MPEGLGLAPRRNFHGFHPLAVRSLNVQGFEQGGARPGKDQSLPQRTWPSSANRIGRCDRQATA
jgi:hypothetical protein